MPYSLKVYVKHLAWCWTQPHGAERGRMARLHVIKVRPHHAAPTPIALGESFMVDRLQVDRSGLQMSSWLGTVIPRWQTSPSSRVGVPKASAFRFVSWTICSPYATLNLRRPSFSSRRCTDQEQSSTAYHICSVTSRLLLSLEEWIHTSNSVTRNYCCRAREVTLSFINMLLTYLLTYCASCTLLRRSSRWRRRLYASMMSICSFVGSSVAKTQFSEN